ncbi:MAG: hypothetical protein L6R35_000510 [Caloplaca aegaea]|nr:MAG: hypothetical protein L6R35_000510 [Caloplaca aegaea]
MLARPWTRTIPGAKDLADFSRVRANHFLRSIHSGRFASSDRWDPRRGIATTTAAARNTALEIRWARAQACEGGGGACVCEATVASAAARCFGAASDIVREAWAGVQDVGSSISSALPGRYADAGRPPCTRARTVGNSSLDDGVRVDHAWD